MQLHLRICAHLEQPNELHLSCETQELTRRTGVNPNYQYLHLDCTKATVDKMLSWAVKQKGKPFCPVGMVRSLIYPRTTDETSCKPTTPFHTKTHKHSHRPVLIAQSSVRNSWHRCSKWAVCIPRGLTLEPVRQSRFIHTLKNTLLYTQTRTSSTTSTVAFTSFQ